MVLCQENMVSNDLVRFKLLPVKIKKADIPSINPSSEKTITRFR